MDVFYRFKMILKIEGNCLKMLFIYLSVIVNCNQTLLFMRKEIVERVILLIR